MPEMVVNRNVEAQEESKRAVFVETLTLASPAPLVLDVWLMTLKSVASAVKKP